MRAQPPEQESPRSILEECQWVADRLRAAKPGLDDDKLKRWVMTGLGWRHDRSSNLWIKGDYYFSSMPRLERFLIDLGKFETE